jgi:ketosteroid isomerase-like protein
MRFRYVLLCVAVLAVGRCGGGGPADAETPKASGAPDGALATILAADRDFDRAVSGRDLSRFLSFISDTATFNGGTADDIRGHAAIAREWAPYFGSDGPTLTWIPTHGEILGGGDLVYTVGMGATCAVRIGRRREKPWKLSDGLAEAERRRVENRVRHRLGASGVAVEARFLPRRAPSESKRGLRARVLETPVRLATGFGVASAGLF